MTFFKKAPKPNPTIKVKKSKYSLALKNGIDTIHEYGCSTKMDTNISGFRGMFNLVPTRVHEQLSGLFSNVYSTDKLNWRTWIGVFVQQPNGDRFVVEIETEMSMDSKSARRYVMGLINDEAHQQFNNGNYVMGWGWVLTPNDTYELDGKHLIQFFTDQGCWNRIRLNEVEWCHNQVINDN